jgi:hypothetical protein
MIAQSLSAKHSEFFKHELLIDFYPNSMNLFSEITSFSRALKIKCNNAVSFDTYGNYREAQIVQIKHHWFWKVSDIFLIFFSHV